MEDQKLSPVSITDKEAIELIHARAKAEKRSFGNAAAVSVIECLGSKYNTKDSQTAR